MANILAIVHFSSSVSFLYETIFLTEQKYYGYKNRETFQSFFSTGKYLSHVRKYPNYS